MNKTFKKIWNKRRGCFVAVSEAMTLTELPLCRVHLSFAVADVRNAAVEVYKFFSMFHAVDPAWLVSARPHSFGCPDGLHLLGKLLVHLWKKTA